MDDDSRTETRRNILKTTGGIGATALGGLALSPGAVAAQGGQSVKEAGITDHFQSLMKEGGTTQAFQLLEEHNVNHSTVTETYSGPNGRTRSNSTSRDVSTESYFEKSNSSVSFYTSEWGQSKSQYAIGISWDLNSYNISVDDPAPQDVAVLAFEQDVFGYVDDSIQHSGVLSTSGGPSSSGKSSVKSEPTSADPEAPSNGAVVTFKDNYRNKDLDNDGAIDWYPNGYGYSQIILRKQEPSTKGIVSGLYTHSWSFGNTASWNILQNVSITIPGTGISVALPFGSDGWKLPSSDKRDQDL